MLGTRSTPRPRAIVRRFAATAMASSMAVFGTACPKRGTPADGLATPPDLAGETGQSKCSVRASASKPLVVEWPAADRAALESRANKGLVAVRYQGCEMEVLAGCSVTGTYAYEPLTRKDESVRIRSADELYAQLPVGAAGLEAKLERTGQLNVDMVIIGRKEADRFEFADDDLDGRCRDATHVITGLTVGAFSFYAGAGAEVGAGVKIGNIGGGASSSSEREVLKQDGNEDACVNAEVSDSERPPPPPPEPEADDAPDSPDVRGSGSGGSARPKPPSGCGALLRVEVVPIDRFGGTTNVASAAAAPAPAPTTSSQTTPHDADPMAGVDPNLEKKIRRWNITQITGYSVGLAGLIGLTVGAVVARSGTEGLSELSTDNGGQLPADDAQAKEVRKVNAGTVVLWSSAAAIGGGFLVGLIGSSRVKSLKKGRVAGAPAVGPGFAGAAVKVRF